MFARFIQDANEKRSHQVSSWLNSDSSDFSFFFQAEDGIRDGTVTGVQTCALPISDIAVERATEGKAGRTQQFEDIKAQVRKDRSEERRVGKSVDLGGRRINKKKIRR